MNWASKSRPRKSIIRDYMLDVSGAKKSAIFLPGWDTQADTGCLCIEQALNKGIINKGTKIIAVERELRLLDRISNRLNSFGFISSPILFGDELHKLRFAKNYPKIDYANFDFLGGMGEDIYQWIKNHFNPHLAQHANVGVTTIRAWRNNHFMDQLAYSWVTTQYKVLARKFAKTFAISDEKSLINILAWNSCFSEFTYEMAPPILYRDSTNMLAMRFDNLVQSELPRNFPTNSEVITAIQKLI